MTGALLSILLLLGLLVLGVPMLVALLAAVILNFFLTGLWPLTLPQTMISGVSLAFVPRISRSSRAAPISRVRGTAGAHTRRSIAAPIARAMSVWLHPPARPSSGS